MRRLNRKRKLPTERSTNVKMPRVIGVKDERVAAETLLLLSEPPKKVKMNTDDLLVAHALCSLGDIIASENSSANAQSNEDYKFDQRPVESEHTGRESERQELNTVPVQDKKKTSQTQQQVN